MEKWNTVENEVPLSVFGLSVHLFAFCQSTFFQAFDAKHKFECVIISVRVTLSFYFALSTFHAFKTAHTEHLLYLRFLRRRTPCYLSNDEDSLEQELL